MVRLPQASSREKNMVNVCRSMRLLNSCIYYNASKYTGIKFGYLVAFCHLLWEYFEIRKISEAVFSTTVRALRRFKTRSPTESGSPFLKYLRPCGESRGASFSPGPRGYFLQGSGSNSSRCCHCRKKKKARRDFQQYVHKKFVRTYIDVSSEKKKLLFE